MKTINRWMLFIIAVVMMVGTVSAQKIESTPLKDFQVEGVSATESKLKKGDKFGLRVNFSETGKSPDETSEIEFTYADFSGNDQISTGDSKKQVPISVIGTNQQLRISGLTFLGGDGNISFKIHAANVSGPKEVNIKLDIAQPPEGTGSIRIKDRSQILIVAGETKKIEIEIENIGTAIAKDSLLSVELEQGKVEGVSLVGGKNIKLAAISPQATSKVSFEIKASQAAKTGNYNLRFQLDGKVQIVSLRIQNNYVPPELQFTIEEAKEIIPGINQSITIKVENIGGSQANQISVKLNSQEGVEIIAGDPAPKITSLTSKQSEYLSYKIKTSPNTNQNKIPVKINYTYQDERGNPNKNTEQYIYLLLNQTGSGQGEVIVQNIVSPKRTVGVGENFNIEFTLAAVQGDIENLKVLVSAENPSAIVPHTRNLFTLSNLKQGVKNQYSVSMSATANAGSQSHPIKIEVTYDSAKTKKSITFKQYTSVDVYNPEIQIDENQEETDKELPKVVVKDYKIAPKTVKAGKEFQLQIGFLNTSQVQSVHNLKINLKAKGQDGSGDQEIFTPVNASSTFYVPTLGTEETAVKTITLHTDRNAKAKTHQIQLELAYKDHEGNEIMTSESIGIPVVATNLDGTEEEQGLGKGPETLYYEDKKVSLLAGLIIVLVATVVIGITFYKKEIRKK